MNHRGWCYGNPFRNNNMKTIPACNVEPQIVVVRTDDPRVAVSHHLASAGA